MTDHVAPIEPAPDWPRRPWLLAGLGAIGGAAIYAIAQWGESPTAGQIAAATFIAVALTLLGITVELRRWWWSLAFAAAGGAVVALVIWWSGGPDAPPGGDSTPWRILCALIVVVMAAPFLQLSAAAGKWRTDYRGLYRHGLSNLIIFGGAVAFVGAAFLVAFLLSRLFELIGIRVLRHLLDEPGLPVMLAGAAFGGAIGVLRDRDRVLGSLQRGVLAVPALLAPVMGAGLLIFLVCLLFTGLTPLWAATRSTTPILLACITGGILLVNAVLGEGRDDESASPLPRFGAMGIGLSLLPLAAIAAVSTGHRITQYGLTPDRLWAVVFTAIAAAYGLAYLVVLAWRRLDWGDGVRAANVRLALGVIAVALVLATPLVGFGAISARNQEARLMTGNLPPGSFDWAAMAFDFGPEGRRALGRLARAAPTSALKAEARASLAAKDRWQIRGTRRQEGEASPIRLIPGGSLPPELADALARLWSCGTAEECVVRWQAGDTEAVVGHFSSGCDVCLPSVNRLRRLDDGRWEEVSEERQPVSDEALRQRAERLRAAVRAGRFEAREVTRQQFFVGDDPVSQPFSP